MMERLLKYILIVVFLIFLPLASLWALMPAKSAVSKAQETAEKQKIVSETRFRHIDQPAPPEILRSIEREQEIKKQVIQKKRKNEQQIYEHIKKNVKPVLKKIHSGLPSPPQKKSRAHGHSKAPIIILVLLVFTALILAIHIYWYKR